MIRDFLRQHPRTGPWVARVERYPGWAIKTAIAVAVLVFVVPLVLLTLAALAAGLVVLLVVGALLAVHAFARAVFAFLFGAPRAVWTGGSRPESSPDADDGRRNVRVLPPRES